MLRIVVLAVLVFMTLKTSQKYRELTIETPDTGSEEVELFYLRRTVYGFLCSGCASISIIAAVSLILGEEISLKLLWWKSILLFGTALVGGILASKFLRQN